MKRFDLSMPIIESGFDIGEFVRAAIGSCWTSGSSQTSSAVSGLQKSDLRLANDSFGKSEHADWNLRDLERVLFLRRSLAPSSVVMAGRSFFGSAMIAWMLFLSFEKKMSPARMGMKTQYLIPLSMRMSIIGDTGQVAKYG